MARNERRFARVFPPRIKRTTHREMRLAIIRTRSDRMSHSAETWESEIAFEAPRNN